VVDQAYLAGIEVLVFVDEQVIEGAGDRAAISFAAIHGFLHQGNHVRESMAPASFIGGFFGAVRHHPVAQAGVKHQLSLSRTGLICKVNEREVQIGHSAAFNIPEAIAAHQN
jgi:hypothetical protein